tara:strand:+ start:438 stop:1343 length:906 start_codon:yes stop_codon:yes gene_type:complete
MFDEFIQDCNLSVFDSNDIIWNNYIDKGSSGKVYKAKVWNRNVICKCFVMENYNSYHSLIEDVNYELNNYQYLERSQYCCELLGISVSNTKKEFYILLKDYNVIGDLYKFINQDKYWSKITTLPNPQNYYYQFENNLWIYKMNKNMKINITKQLCIAIKDIHDRNLVHCDLKLNNILYLPDQNKIILIDFGASHYLGCQSYDFICENMGTYGYTCEQLNEGYCSKKSDIYSLAVCILEIWCGGIWNKGETIKECRLEVLSSLRKLKKKEPQLSKILKSCLVLETDKRPYIKTVIKNMNTIF